MEDDYESLPSSSPWHHHMIAGSIAGILEHSAVYPIDLIKTRLMCVKPIEEARYSGLIDGFQKVWLNEGFKRTWRGVPPVIVGAGPAHALYFSAYEFIKNNLSSEKYPYLKSFAYGLAGGSATLLHDAIMTPADAIKQRMQVYNSPYTSNIQCLNHVVKNQGIGALYRAYTTQLSISVPHHMLFITSYELLHDLFNKDRLYKPIVHVSAGALSGAFAAFITTPLDVCKTAINTQPEGKIQINGLISSARYVYKCGGSKAFFRGSLARVVYTMPGTAISWSVYEFFKHSLWNNSMLREPVNILPSISTE